MANNRVVVLTGAASGIGLGIAKAFVNSGATVIGVDFNESALKEAAKDLGENFVGRLCDVSSEKQISSLSTYVEETCGNVDVLINNAGGVRLMSPEAFSEEDFYFHYNVIVKGSMLCVKHFTPLLRKSQNPSIVNMSSIAARIEYANHFLYTTAKAAVEKYTRNLVRDLWGIRVNTILPGVIDTPIYGKMLAPQGGDPAEIRKQVEAYYDQLKTGIPSGRIGTPDDIADCILFLSSEKAGYINGASIVIDGGLISSGSGF